MFDVCHSEPIIPRISESNDIVGSLRRKVLVWLMASDNIRCWPQNFSDGSIPKCANFAVKTDARPLQRHIGQTILEQTKRPSEIHVNGLSVSDLLDSGGCNV